MKKFLVFALSFCITACTSDMPSYSGLGLDNTTLGDNGVERIIVSDATTADCPAGGKVYVVYIDTNANNINDIDETPLSTQIVCNGVNGSNGSNGSNGFSTVFGMNRIAIDAGTCSSTSGLQINSGIDIDRNGILGAAEITDTALLCDGQNGQAGAAGAAGSNGHSMQYSVSVAPAEICAAGGSILFMALDIHDNGFYSVTDPGQQQMTICNGLNGTNGTNGTNGIDAPVASYSAVDVIVPCGPTVTYKEVLLRLANGQVLASFSDNISGLNTRLSLIPDGSYMNTDGSNCSFQISTSGNERSISWFNQIQNTWTLPTP